jgi:hydrogenase nickel incorporation protein HypA/HybF
VHELSIAQSLIEIVDRHACGGRVMRVEVKVGRLRQVVPDALGFAFELVAQGTGVEGAELVLEDVPAAGTCGSCGSDTPLPELPLACRRCGSFDVDVTQGEELRVEALEIEEPEDAEQPRHPSGLEETERPAEPAMTEAEVRRWPRSQRRWARSQRES